MISKKQRIAGALATGAVTLAALGGGVAARGAKGVVAPAVVLAPVPGGGGGGALNVNMSPAMAFTSIGGLNEDPTAPRAIATAVPRLRWVPRGVLSVELTNLDPARFPLAKVPTTSCAGVITLDGIVQDGIVPVPAASPAVGTSIGASIPTTMAGPHMAKVDLSCTSVDKKTSVQSTHQTHWVGSL